MADDKTTGILDIEAGAAVRGAFRGELERLKFLGYPISWHEHKGWIESAFTIKAPTSLLHAINKWVEEVGS